MQVLQDNGIYQLFNKGFPGREGRLKMVYNKQMKQKVHQRYKTVPGASTVV